MTSRLGYGASAVVVLTLVSAACGGSVTVNEGGAGGTGGAGASAGSGGATSSSSSSGTTSSGTGGFTGGGGTGGIAGGGGTGGMVLCGELGEVACLGAYPSCVPVYDDRCCPTCVVGTCADCIDLAFDHCAPAAAACPAPPSCGFTPDWACQGGVASCGIDPFGSPTPCHTVAGCTAAYCPTNADCKTDPICKPVTKDVCTSLCDSIPPPCPPGTTGEMDGFCYTGLCIAQELCGFGP